MDGAQSTPHMKVDVQDFNADFFAMSGHKLCGPMGIGALYGKRALLEEIEPFLRGGEMIEYVTREKATWAEVPHKFEAGTVSAGDAVGMAAAKCCGIITFTLDGVHPHDIASFLSEEQIAIRAGHHCTQPLGQYLNQTATARASLYFYNTEEEVDFFLEKVAKLREWSGYKD